MTDPTSNPQSASPRPLPRRGRTLFRLVVALAILAVVVCVAGRQAGVGCSMFPGEEKPGPAVANPSARPVDLMAGHWEGTWSNTSDSMGGRLTCRITPLEAGRDYQAEFHAVFAKVLTYDSTVTLTVQREGATWKFHGEKDLGLMGGVFTYDGHTDGREFYSTYDSRLNKGAYRMTRRGATSQPSSGPAGG